MLDWPAGCEIIRQLAQNFLISIISWLGSGLKKSQVSQGSKPQTKGSEGSWIPLLRTAEGFASGGVTERCSSTPRLPSGERICSEPLHDSMLTCHQGAGRVTTVSWVGWGKRENTYAYVFTRTFNLALKCSFVFRYALRDTDVWEA